MSLFGCIASFFVFDFVFVVVAAVNSSVPVAVVVFLRVYFSFGLTLHIARTFAILFSLVMLALCFHCFLASQASRSASLRNTNHL